MNLAHQQRRQAKRIAQYQAMQIACATARLKPADAAHNAHTLRPVGKSFAGTRVAHCDDQGTWADANRTVKAPRTKVSHREASATRTAPQARYTSSLTMAGIAHQGSLALKKV